MGLDFWGYWLHKGETTEELYARPYNEYMDRELFYARKGWELVNALNCTLLPPYRSELRLEDWVNLMDKLSVIGDYFPEIQQAYKTIGRVSDEYDSYLELKRVYPREMELIELYEAWYNQSFDDILPQLGYEFSVGYMYDFWLAADKVLEYLEDPEYEVWMIASY